MGRRGFGLLSLRAKLAIAAFVALAATVAVTALLVMTANAAYHVTETAWQAQQRSRVYLQLQAASTDYQHASYAAIRQDDPLLQRRVTETRARMENLLAEVTRLPVSDAADRAGNRNVRDQVAELIVHFSHSDQLMQRVNQQWRQNGGAAAMREASRISAPIYVLRETLLREITRGDSQVSAATDQAYTLINRAVWAACAALLLALVSSILVMVLLQTRLRPGLASLEQGVAAFGKGDLTHRIGEHGTDELAKLARAFNTMAQTIADKQAALHKAQQGLEQTVAERTAELRAAHDQLAEADERRRAFFAEISHELRTPLTVIRGESQVAQRVLAGDDHELSGTLDRILDQTNLLTRMVTDLFLIARVHSGGLRLEPEMTGLRALAGGVAGDFENLAAEGGGSIRLAEGVEVMAMVDPGRVKRALLALVENALVHCPSGANIVVGVEAAGDMVTISVADDGPGVDFAQADRLFERFRRGTSSAKGTGLGLSLVSALATAHGGSASLGPAQGGGTRACLHLPALPQLREVA